VPRSCMPYGMPYLENEAIVRAISASARSAAHTPRSRRMPHDPGAFRSECCVVRSTRSRAMR